MNSSRGEDTNRSVSEWADVMFSLLRWHNYKYDIMIIQICDRRRCMHRPNSSRIYYSLFSSIHELKPDEIERLEVQISRRLGPVKPRFYTYPTFRLESFLHKTQSGPVVNLA